MSLQDGAGCWAWRRSGWDAGGGALFLDRDGVVVEDVHHLRRIEDVALIPRAAETIAAANAAGWPVVVVTNQSGVARGLFGWADFEAVQAEIEAQLRARGAGLDAVYACGYHEAGTGALGVADHPWRKPHPGMLLAAAAAVPGLALDRSLIVGDRASDLAAGRAAGLPLGVHVSTGHGGDEGERAAARALAGLGFKVRPAVSLADVAALLPHLQRT